MSDLQLHPTKGVNARMGKCPRCGQDNGEIVLMGKHDYKDICTNPECRCTHYGGAPKRKCVKCGYGTKREPIDEYEKIVGDLCDKCEAEELERAFIVALGGIYLRCKDCGVRGVLEPAHEAAVGIRAEALAGGEIGPPDENGKHYPIGIEIGADQCPYCNDEQETVQ